MRWERSSPRQTIASTWRGHLDVFLCVHNTFFSVGAPDQVRLFPHIALSVDVVALSFDWVFFPVFVQLSNAFLNAFFDFGSLTFSGILFHVFAARTVYEFLLTSSLAASSFNTFVRRLSPSSVTSVFRLVALVSSCSISNHLFLSTLFIPFRVLKTSIASPLSRRMDNAEKKFEFPLNSMENWHKKWKYVEFPLKKMGKWLWYKNM